MGTFRFWWTLVALILTLSFTPSFSFATGFIDLFVSVQLIRTTYLQSKYAPLNPRSCSEPGIVEYRANLPLLKPSFSSHVAGVASNQDNFHEICKSYAIQYRYGISISTVYAFMAATGIVYLAIHIWNLILVFSGFELGWSCVYYDIEGNFLRFAVHIVQVPRWIFWIFALPIYYFPLVLFRTIVHRDVQALLRYPPRLALKIYQRLAQRAEAQKRPANAATELLDLTPLPNTPKPPLASLLSTYDILLLIAANLHYSDFRNLTLASRHVRHAALHRLPPDHYIRYTCHPDERTGRIRCFLCDIPCCTSCCTFTPIRQSPLPFHLESCRPYCHGCYITHIHRDPHTYDGNELMATTCECHPEPSRLQWLWDYLYRAEYLETENTQERRHVCRQCNTLNDRELTKKWDRRAMWELMHPEAREGMNSCVMCKKDVRGALRWWVCGECGLECTSGVHLA